MEKPKPSAEVLVEKVDDRTVVVYVFTQDAMTILDEAKQYGDLYSKTDSGHTWYVFVYKIYNTQEVADYLIDFAKQYNTSKLNESIE